MLIDIYAIVLTWLVNLPTWLKIVITVALGVGTIIDIMDWCEKNMR